MRLDTKGNPAEIVQDIGRAKNLLARELSKMDLSGDTQRRVSAPGIDIRIDTQGINQVMINHPEEAKLLDVVESIKYYNAIVVYLYEGKKDGAISEYSYKDIAAKTRRYFGTAPARNLSEAGECGTVVILSPKRILSDVEKRVFKTWASRGKRIVLFPGSDITIFNAILEQLGSIFELIPYATQTSGGYFGILPNSTLLNLPATRRGWLKVRDSKSDLATVKDPFGKGLGFNDIITIIPAFTLPTGENNDLVSSVWGQDIITFLEEMDEDDDFNFVRNNLFPISHIVDDWTTITIEVLLSWLDTIKTYFPLILKKPLGHIFSINDSGWLTFADHALYDIISANMAYYTKDNLLVSGLEPYWFNGAYNREWDDQYYNTRVFSKWLAGKWGNTDVFAQMFYNMMPYPYNYTYAGEYHPPIQW